MRDRYQVNDNELLYLYRQGDEEAFSALVSKYRRIMLAYARGYESRVKTSCELQDIYQVSIIALYNAVNTYKENMGCRFSSYFKIVMERAVFNHIRHLYSDKSRANKEAISMDQLVRDHEGIYIVDTIAIPDKGSNPNWVAHIREVFREIDTVVVTFSKVEQQIYQLWSEGFSYREISHLTNVSEKKIDNVLHALKKKLRKFVVYE